MPHSGPWRIAPYVLYLFALAYARDRVPSGLNNDAAEETLRGLLLLDHGRFEVITTVFGIPQETLYLYGEAAVAKLLGTTTLAIQLTSWCAALACAVLFVRLVARLDRDLPTWVPLLLALSSPWLFHYARSGLRAISAPFFLLAFCLLLDRAEHGPRSRGAAVAAGGVLGLGLYAYTSCRVLVVALIFHSLVRLWRGATQRQALIACYATIAGAALLVSIPSLAALASDPRGFLLRGGYVLLGGAGAASAHLLWSFLLPFHYPDHYRTLVSPTHIFDGVSAAFSTSGMNPVPLAVALLLPIGFALALLLRARAGASFLLWTWMAGTVLLGVSGPSLTRLFILLPVFLAFAALAVGALLRRFPRSSPAVGILLVAVLAWDARAYFWRFASDAQAQSYFSPAATPIGKRARTLAASGERVLCVVAKDANVVHYLTYDHTELVRVVEFFRRPPDPAMIPIGQFGPDVLLIENQPSFARLLSVFPAARRRAHAEFEEIRLATPAP